MHLDYKNLDFDKDGIPEQPELVLKTMDDDVIGTIPGIFDLKLNIKFSEPSTIEFDVAAVLDDGEPNWIYDRLTGYKIIYTEKYGIYMITGMTTENDGISNVKHIEGKSIEYMLNTKKFFIEEGTFRFCDLTDPTNEDTLIGRILEIAPGWSIDYVSPTLAQKYRTFDQYDDFLLSFMYGDAKDKFRCIFVFDPYERTISAYDADEEVAPLPIYLDFDNLLSEVEIEELTDELITAIRPYGADDLNIVNVNPIGSNWLYDLSYFIDNGDIPSELAAKWVAWQEAVRGNQEYYKGLVALQSSSTSRLLIAQTALTELRGELETLQAQQSVIIQALALETTSQGKSAKQSELTAINSSISAKEAQIAIQEEIVEDIQAELDPETVDSYANQIRTLVNSLSIKNNFTDAEYETLSKYFIEQDITEDTFVASTLDATTSGSSYALTGASVAISDSAITEIDLTDDFDKTMYVFNGGSFSVEQDDDFDITGEVIRGTLEVNDSGAFVLSLYGGTITNGDVTVQSGTIVVTGSYLNFASDITPVTVDEVTTNEGTEFSFDINVGTLYLTANVSDYQKYSVQTELYDYAVNLLSDLATPTYEFSVDSGNFIFDQEFGPFRDELELGRGIYLNVGHDRLITPNIIEFELSFEDYSKFSMVFSNRFKRYDQVNTLKDMVEKSYSYSRNFDASKHIYSQTVSQASAVSKYMQDALDSAVNTIVAASNQSVIINGAGIHVSNANASDSNIDDFQLRIVNGMIAMTKDNWATADLAIGAFKTDSGYHFGVNAEVIGGNLIVGNELIIESPQVDQQGQPTGVMQFKVDGSGAWLNNSTFVLQSDANNGGKIIIDPNYGILAGGSNLYTVSGTTITPSFIDITEDPPGMTFDNDGMPTNANFFLDINNGNAYFRGKVNATSGQIGGFTLESDYMHAGSGTNYIALNGSGSNANSTYAIWAGHSSPGSANFSVTKAGKVTAKNIDVTGGTITIGNNFAVSNTGNITANSGTFKGTLDAAVVKGDLTATSDTGGGWLIGCGIKVGVDTSYPNGKFYVDQNGNVTMAGSINMSSASSITWGSSNSPTLVLYARTALSEPTDPYSSYNASSSTAWHKTMNSTYDKYASYTYDGGNSWTAAVKIVGTDGQDGQDGQDGSDANVPDYIKSTYIDSIEIKSPTITGNQVIAKNAFIVRNGNRNFGGMGRALGSTDSQSTTDGVAISAFVPDENGMIDGTKSTSATYPYIIVTTAGARMQAFGHNIHVASGGCYADSSIIQTSDQRLKNSISDDLNNYIDFFMTLKPSIYKWNNGTSNRFHIGFIAQQVEEAILKSGLSTQEFAGLCIKKPEERRPVPVLENQYSLRYDEFIALNTYMIQKLYKEIDSLKDQIQKLQEAI